MRVTAPSAWPWLDHPVSGLIRATLSCPKTRPRPFKTRFRSASAYRLKLAAPINSLTHYTRGTPSPRRQNTDDGRQKPKLPLIRRPSSAVRAPTACRHPVSGSLSLPSSGCFSPFPHGTCPLSLTKEYLGLEGGPPIFRQDYTCPALLEDDRSALPVRGSHPLWPAFPDASGCSTIATGLIRVRSPLLAESRHRPITADRRIDVLSSGY